jgi:AcrR family transcriptional regulator
MTARARKPRARAATELTHEAISTAALALIDRDGIDAFSMRKLGAQLGCEGMALYWYYPSKDELLDAVVERMMLEVAAVLDGDTRDWVAVLRNVARAYRRLAHAHPRAFPLAATRRFSTEGTFTFLERLFGLAHEHGIDDHTIARFYRVVSSYCNGFALHELARQPAAPRTKYARLAAVSAHLEPRQLDEIFEFGLALQLDALARETRNRR